MDKEVLKKKLDEVKKKIKSNSKDAHFADTLVDELLSLKGQLGVEPTLVHIAMDDIEKSLKSDTFEMCITKRGDAIYHTYGGYTIIANGYRMNALARTITQYVMHEDIEKELSEDEKELFTLDLEATAHVLNIPSIAFADANLKYDLATIVVKYLREFYESALKEDLQEETYAQDVVFEDATKALEDIKNAVKE